MVIAPSPVALRTFTELRNRAQQVGPKRVAVVAADDEIALTAAGAALQMCIAHPVLIGNAQKIRSTAAGLGLDKLCASAEFVHADSDLGNVAACMARDGRADVLLKGHLRTDELLHAVLEKKNGLRTKGLLSDILLYEDVLAGERRLVGLTDGGLNVSPSLDQKKQIVENAIALMRCLGIERPKIAIMSASEVVSESLPSTLDARALTEMGTAGVFGDAEVYGPLALDNALVESAAKAKGIYSRVAGHADCLVAPNIEAGNMFGKSVKYLGQSQCGHIIVGAKIPILIPSRVEGADDKLNAIALGVLFATHPLQQSPVSETSKRMRSSRRAKVLVWGQTAMPTSKIDNSIALESRT